MAYNIQLAERVREHLAQLPGLAVEEKKMFGGLAFMVNNKMCINVRGENLMCRFNPALLKEVASKPGFTPMVMKGKEYKGYCYVKPAGFQNENDFEYWVNLCLAFNQQAKQTKPASQKGRLNS